MVSPFHRLSVPTFLTTDVNAAAFGEMEYGNHDAGTRTVAYITVGTGV